MSKPPVERRDEYGDRIAVVTAYAPGDGRLSFVAKDPRTNIATSPSPTREECAQVCPDGWVLYEDGPYFRARCMLRCETDTPEMGARVQLAAVDLLCQSNMQPYEFATHFEHGQWWVTHLPSGAQWSANDAEGPRDAEISDGFCFEQVTEGEEIPADDITA